MSRVQETLGKDQGRVTLQAIAARLDVSTATVSLALRDSPVVAETTRTRVRKLAEEMGYIYNRSAAALRTDRSQIVGLGINDITNPYFAELLNLLEEAVGAQGRSILLGTYGESRPRQQRVLRTLKEYRPDGLILCPAGGSTADDFAGLVPTRIPVVFLSRSVDGLPFDFVGGDEMGAMRTGVRHLAELGHRRIAMLGGSDLTSTGRERLRGYREGLADCGLPHDPDLEYPGYGTRELGVAGITAVLERPDPPSAAICFSDLVAFGAMLGLRHAGREAGRDFSIVGYDDNPEAALWYPALTTIRVPPAEMVANAVGLMHSRMAEPGLPQRRIILPTELIVRSSTIPA
jgi:LacI family transcriptional regulator